MPLLAAFTQDPGVREALAEPPDARVSVASTGSWERLLRLVRERPATCVVLDSARLAARGDPVGAVRALQGDFPSLGILLLARRDLDPYALFRLGQAGIGSLVLLDLDDLRATAPDVLRSALGRGTSALVTRALSPYLPPRVAEVLRLALHGVQMGWGTEDAARALGLTRPHVSVLLKEVGMPSLGHLIVWCRLFHAGRWLCDPGRSAESVSRQLEYSSGAAFRRALKHYVGLTPTAVRKTGGLARVLASFLEHHPIGGAGLGRGFAA